MENSEEKSINMALSHPVQRRYATGANISCLKVDQKSDATSWVE